MSMWSDYMLSVSLVNPLMSFMNSSPLMSFMIPERKSGLYRQMLNVLKDIYCQLNLTVLYYAICQEGILFLHSSCSVKGT
jgi:hypothetical protein